MNEREPVCITEFLRDSQIRYGVYMAKKAVSLMLDEGNVLLLRGRGYGHGNLSVAVDNLITAARAGRLGTPPAVRSVVGTIDIAADDSRLERADRAMRDLFSASSGSRLD